ncbi:MAG TPA: M43 family zinc metalloprotease, partial [Candidatus Woesebacteria bacterium]|nr:M43 family zinc metalloprotease [Candidatus Woesebacteria bacterium]
EEYQVFQTAAASQIDSINRMFSDSNAPFRVVLAETRVGSGSCSTQQQFCLIVDNLIQTDDPFWGFVPYIPNPDNPGPEYDRPNIFPMFVDPYALADFKGCAPMVEQTINEQSICNGSLTIGNGTVAHEFGHILGLDHPFGSDCSFDADGIPDTPIEKMQPNNDYRYMCIDERATVDSCRDSGEQKPDGVNNVMGYHAACTTEEQCSMDNKTFSQQQILRMLNTLEKVFPTVFIESRRSEIRAVNFTSTPDGKTAIEVEFKAGQSYRVRLNIENESSDTLPEFVQNPPQVYADPSETGTTTIFQYDASIENPTTVWATLQTKPVPIPGGIAFKDFTVWEITSEDTKPLGRTDTVEIIKSNTQEPLVNNPTQNYNACGVDPYEYLDMPFIRNEE